jgi:DNA repair photolyase
MDSPASQTHPLRGRAALSNPGNRFEQLHYELEQHMEVEGESPPAPRTLFYCDASRSIISRNDSPDLGFRASINPYRGCEHGCIYCYARPTHEYLGFSAGLDFESRIMVKVNAADLLRAELSSPAWTPQVLAVSGVTDCYQPAERVFKLTRACLEVIVETRNPVAIVTKNHLVTRDIDLLQQLTPWRAVAVYVSITTLDSALARALEPRASSPAHRLETIKQLAQVGIPTGVLIAPVIPVLTEPEMPAILEAAREAGASFAGYSIIRLPHGVKDLFRDWLDHHMPGKAAAILNRIRELRGGKLNDPDFGTRLRGQGTFAEQIRQIFEICARRYKYQQRLELSVEAFRRPAGRQLLLF